MKIEKRPDRFPLMAGSVKDIGRIEKGKRPLMKGWETHVVMTASPEEVKAVRGKLHKSQAQLAKILGVSVSTVRSWEQGIRRPEGLATKVIRLLEKQPALSDALQAI